MNAQLIRDEILALKEQGATILLSTHNMESVEQLCDNIALINKSRLVISGSVDAIRRDYGQHRRSVEYTGAPLQPDSAVFDLVSDEAMDECRMALLAPAPGADNAAVLTALLAQGANILSFSETTTRMNDIFISLVQS